MKRRILVFLLLLHSIRALTQSVVAPSKSTSATGVYDLSRRDDGILMERNKMGGNAPVKVTPYMSIAELRKSKFGASSMPVIINITDSRKQGVFMLSAGDTTNDNTGTVIRTVGGLCYRRVFTNAIDAGWFTVGDGIVDDRDNLQKAVNVAGQTKSLLIDTGQPTYKVTGTIHLRAGMAGLMLNGLISASGSGYTIVETERTFRYKQFKIQIEGNGKTLNGLLLNNPLLSEFQTIRVHNLNGFGIKIIECWDCVFFNISVELCGNSTSYAFSLTENGDTSNMSNFLRLQVEQSHQLAIYISPLTLSCIFNNIHSERQYVSGIIKNTWFLGGNTCTYNNVRLTASNGAGYMAALARTYISMAGGRANEIRVDSYSPVQAEAGGPRSCYLSNVSFPNFERVGAGDVFIEKGRIDLLQGNTAGLHVTDVTCLTVSLGFSANNDQALDFREGSIGTLISSSTQARIKATSTTINGGKPASAVTFLINSTLNLGTQTIGYNQIYTNNSRIIGNIATDNGHFEFLNNTVIDGNLSIGPNRSVIFDASSYVNGVVKNMGPPESSTFAGGFPVGRRIWNPAPKATGPEYWTCTVAGVKGAAGTWTAH